MPIDIEKETQAAELKGSLLLFTRFFYKYLTGRDFIVSSPPGRESHHITVCKAFMRLFREQKHAYGLLINLPPGYGKSVMTSMWIAWCYAHYPDCNFLYISYSHGLAAAHTSFIKQIITSKMFRYLFEVEISGETRAKDHFMTTVGGSVAAFGSSGAVTGRNAGNIGLNRFSGCVVIDDAHKPDEVHSDPMRESVIRNYNETIMQRPRDNNVPIVFIGQRLHEEDLAAYLMSGKDVRTWDKVILKGIDDAGNALYPEVQSLEYLKTLQDKQPYVFASQIQQDPLPSGGALFRPEWFLELHEEPEILMTFITADTAETSKSYNDATAFSFWGIYEMLAFGRKTGELGLHWLDTLEIRVEPKELKDSFIDFWGACSLHKIAPRVAAIERKSTGVTLASVLADMQGLSIRNVERTAASGSKTARYLEMQPHIASKRVTFTKGARHMLQCIEHMRKITANDTHRHDDICDTLYDAIKISLIDKLIYKLDVKQDGSKIAQSFSTHFNKIDKLRKSAYNR